MLLGIASGLLLAPAVLTAQTGSAATLEVSAAPIQVWEAGDLPPLPDAPDLSACGPLDQYDAVIVGTSGKDILGVPFSHQRQLLIGLGGDDVLLGGKKGDCLVSGDGNDILVGGMGPDVLIGGRGQDLLVGGLGVDDYYAGGDAGDVCVNLDPHHGVRLGCDDSASSDHGFDLGALLQAEGTDAASQLGEPARTAPDANSGRAVKPEVGNEEGDRARKRASTGPTPTQETSAAAPTEVPANPEVVTEEPTNGEPEAEQPPASPSADGSSPSPEPATPTI